MRQEIFYLTKSKTKTAILELFFNNPEKEHYLRQMERITGYSVGNIRREIVKLEKSDLFSSRILGKVKLYKLNTHHPIYNEIRNIVRKTIGIEARLKTIIGKQKKVKFAFIYGSFAKGEEKGASDIDIILIGDMRPKEIKSKLYEYQSEVQREVNSTVYSTSEFLNRVKNKNHFLTSVIKEPKVFLKGSENEFREFIQIR